MGTMPLARPRHSVRPSAATAALIALTALAVPAALAGGSCSSGASGDDEVTPPGDGGDSTDDDSAGAEVAPPGIAPPRARIEVTPAQGSLPLTVHLSAAGSLVAAGPAEVAWTLDSGDAASGVEADVVLVASGTVQVTATVTDALGRVDAATARVVVEPGQCPQAGEATSDGALELAEIDETSGVVESRAHPGVLWIHNDSGDSPRLFAVAADGRHLGTFDLEGAPSGDWEDIAIAPDGGGWTLVAGDVGDNGRVRESVTVYLVPEPAVDPSQEPVTQAVTFEALELTYPDGEARDCETIAVDPVSGDLLLVTKSWTGPASVYRKPAPLEPGGPYELELVAELDFSAPPLSGIATTGGDVSPLGDRLVIRTYGRTAFVWLWDRAETLAEVLAADPCTVEMPQEQQAESIAFAADGSGLWSISEGEGAAVDFVPFDG